eukprot:1653062-Prymnesium_polylepis.5
MVTLDSQAVLSITDIAPPARALQLEMSMSVNDTLTPQPVSCTPPPQPSLPLVALPLMTCRLRIITCAPGASHETFTARDWPCASRVAPVPVLARVRLTHGSSSGSPPRRKWAPSGRKRNMLPSEMAELRAPRSAVMEGIDV